MSSAAHSMLNRFRHISKNSTAPAASSHGAQKSAAANISQANSNSSNARQERLAPRPLEASLFTEQAIEDLLTGIPDYVLPSLALADGANAFEGDATNDWFYPGRYLRGGVLPDVDLVEGQFMDFAVVE